MRNDELVFQHVTHPKGLFGPGTAPIGGLSMVPTRALGSGPYGAEGPAEARVSEGPAEAFPTFLGDADGATAHAHAQGIYTSINEVLGLSSRDHYGEEQGKACVKV